MTKIIVLDVYKRDDMKNVRCHNHGINYNIIFDAVMTQIKEVITTNKYKPKASEKEKDITNDINRYSKPYPIKRMK